MSGPYTGPCLVASRDEAARILDALHGHNDAVAVAICKKCTAVLASDPKWREPLK